MAKNFFDIKKAIKESGLSKKEVQRILKETKKEYTVRKVDPDYVGYSKDGKNNGLWASYDHYRREGPRVFKPDSIQGWKVTAETFEPSQRSRTRWKEMIPLYEERKLNKISF